ncbi:uncharacterized protein Z518_04251 [Rhinocladiella mackenziei CBS 650.93]|uniref:Rhinocladiella mackenziei CBS 650.93 unplaced genomic scaffold supercont1.3, whole genome shotgun sequence n=1 Tax=Rhinocladiella mackenziei CBS 650.93 TaxID=1442369 RepID=A0A0D2ISW3_9EURO|nr:uncharacterized protein Z518_04251 [Rhinocladiella mackenziei CBS 650.93]KIX06276.1 hypothetical protein Z518_04251 [Rhinocladiella mackenziei CBS 650.93]
MDVPRPDGPDVDRGTSIFIGCWVLTAVVFFVLLFRFGVKAWIAWLLPSISKPERVWGYEDFFFAFGYAFDVAHMALIWKSHEWGLGRHFFYLSPIERNLAMKYDFISQPLAVSAAMWSRTGVIIFLYTCFAQNRKSLRVIIVVCLVVQIIANLFTILQIFLQCGPNPYRLVNRAAYFHYMWDPLPEDGSVVCQDPSVQATVGYVQGAFNTIIDFTLTYLAGLELWQFMFRAADHGRQTSFMTRFKKLDPSIRNQRLWQTLLLCGPLLLSGVASIVKTYLLSALGSRSDFTWNIVPFILWVKIENHSIPIATTAPILRLFIRTFTDQRGGGKGYGLNSSGGQRSKSGHIELSHRSHNKSGIHRDDKGFVHMRDTDYISETVHGGSFHGSEHDLVSHNNGIVVKHEYEVRVEEGRDEGKDRDLPIMQP